MNVLKNVFARVWAVWGLLSFILTFLIIVGPSMGAHLYKNEKQGQDYFMKVSKLWMQFWLFLVGCPLTVKGKDYFKQNENYVVTHNHQTFLDVPITCPFVPGGNKTIAKDTFAKVPIFGWFYKRGGVMVNRKSDRSRSESFNKMKQALAAGMHMCIFPEGTRNRTKAPLKTFYDGAFKLAVDTKKEVIPALLFNTGKAMPNNKKLYLLPHKLSIHFLPPISSINKTAESLKEEVYKNMWDYYVANAK
jgi:1-acyl-sn-glycerol-3-phosphate acyltransferase